jgi:uncharacterized phage protein gp47/JayE
MVNNLVPTPVLDSRDDAQIAAEAIARVTGVLTVDRIEKNIEQQRALLALAQAGALSQSVCPELTNANPSSPHTVLIEALAWLVALMGYKINQVPEQNLIAFARLFRIELREATAATTTLRFTVEPPQERDVTVPAGTQVATEEGDVIFTTDEELLIPSGETAGEVSATRTVAGVTTLTPDELTNLLDSLGWVTAVTNPEAVESGSATESTASALERARIYQRRGKRLVSREDIEDAIREEVLGGTGIVRAFPFVKDGDYAQPLAGHTTVVVMTNSGGPVSSEVKRRIGTLLGQAVGSQFIYIKDPSFHTFNVSYKVRLTGLATQSATLAAVETNLRAFYAAVTGNFGRTILRSEIIAIIEGTPGVDRIEAQPDGAILASPVADITLAPYELPKLETVTPDVI